MNMNKKLLFVALSLSLGLSSKAQVDLVPDTVAEYNEADFIADFNADLIADFTADPALILPLT